MFQNTKSKAQEMNFPEAKLNMMDIDFPDGKEYKNMQKKKNQEIDEQK